MIATTITTDTTLRIRDLDLAVSGVPQIKTQFVYYTVTGLAIRYENEVVTRLTITGIAEDTGATERITVRLDVPDMWEPWVRDLVEEYRPSA